MMLSRTAAVALALATLSLGPAAAQFGGMPGMPGAPAVPGSPVTPGVPFGATQQPPAACHELLALREEVSKHGQAIQAAGRKTVAAGHLCKLFGVFTAAEAKMLEGLETQKATCGVPAEVIAQVKDGHTKSTQIAERICEAAAQRPKPRDPSLSDLLRPFYAPPTYTPIGDFPPSCSEVRRLGLKPVPCVH